MPMRDLEALRRRPRAPGASIETDVREIMSEGSLECAYQPIVSVRERKIVGLEALARARDPRCGRPIPADELFRAAAAQGCVLELDRHCRRHAIGGFVPVSSADPSLLVFLNLDTSILNSSIVGSNNIVSLVEDAGLSPGRVVIELLESRVEDAACLGRFVSAHREQGFLIGLDDMGIGHSNLERIAALKPDVIKLDRALIRGIDREHHKQELYQLFIKLALRTGAVVIAEGIEEREQALTCLERGGDLMQGYLFSPPLSPGIESLRPCLDRVMDTDAASKAREGLRNSERQALFARYSRIADDMRLQIAGSGRADLDGLLGACIKPHLEVQCAYALDPRGAQISATVLNPLREGRPSTALFAPAARGSDQSSKEYYLFLDPSRRRYITEPYISRASGARCVTVSTRLADAEGLELILCLDLDMPL